MNDPQISITILLIEDNEGDILLTQKAFCRASKSNQLFVARNGKEGLAFLHQEGDFVAAPRPDLILLDLNMPEMTGHELLKIIKNHPSLSPIPVIILSTSPSPEDVVRSYTLEASSFIKKPIDFREFGEMIEQLQKDWFPLLLEKKQTRSENS